MRDIFKRAVGPVSQQRHPTGVFPAASQEQDVEAAVVVVVGVHAVQRADLFLEARGC